MNWCMLTWQVKDVQDPKSCWKQSWHEVVAFPPGWISQSMSTSKQENADHVPGRRALAVSIVYPGTSTTTYIHTTSMWHHQLDQTFPLSNEEIYCMWMFVCRMYVGWSGYETSATCTGFIFSWIGAFRCLSSLNPPPPSSPEIVCNDMLH